MFTVYLSMLVIFPVAQCVMIQALENGRMVWRQGNYRNRNSIPVPEGYLEKKHKRDVEDDSTKGETKKSFIGKHFSMPLGAMLPIGYAGVHKTGERKSNVPRLSFADQLSESPEDSYKIIDFTSEKRSPNLSKTWGLQWKSLGSEKTRDEKAYERSNLGGEMFISEEDFDSGLMRHGLGVTRDRERNEIIFPLADSPMVFREIRDLKEQDKHTKRYLHYPYTHYNYHPHYHPHHHHHHHHHPLPHYHPQHVDHIHVHIHPPPPPTQPPTPEDAGTPAPDDTGTPAPENTSSPAPEDATTPPPEDAGTPPPEDSATPPPEDAGTPPPEDSATPPPEDAGTPSPEDAAAPPTEDAGASLTNNASALPQQSPLYHNNQQLCQENNEATFCKNLLKNVYSSSQASSQTHQKTSLKRKLNPNNLTLTVPSKSSKGFKKLRQSTEKSKKRSIIGKEYTSLPINTSDGASTKKFIENGTVVTITRRPLRQKDNYTEGTQRNFELHKNITDVLNRTHLSGHHEYEPIYGDEPDGEFDVQMPFQTDGMPHQYQNHDYHHNVANQHLHAPYNMHVPHDDYKSPHPGHPYEDDMKSIVKDNSGNYTLESKWNLTNIKNNSMQGFLKTTNTF